PTLEILEESLLDFPGALILVTHDRYLLDRVSTVVLGLDGRGGVERFADYSQWEAWQAEKEKVESKATAPTTTSKTQSASGKKKLSYAEAREYDSMEALLEAGEEELESKRAAVQSPEITKDGRLLERAYRDMEEAQATIDRLYERWAELESKLN
ncbi:MAG: ABC transporter ATP-binding protein, partial [Acidobacteriota bacterium]